MFYSYARHVYNEVVTLSFMSFLKISVFSFQHSFRCCRLIVLCDSFVFQSQQAPTSDFNKINY